jgi:hypothetical protein
MPHLRAQGQTVQTVLRQGLRLEIKPNGVKAWRHRFELRDGDAIKESIFAIGDYAIAPSGETPEEPRSAPWPTLYPG